MTTATNFDFDFSGLYEFQKSPAHSTLLTLLEKGRNLDTSDTGVGKTYAVGSVLRYLQNNFNTPFFVVCPRNVKLGWRQACAHFNIKPIAIVTYEKLARGNTKYCSWVRPNEVDGAVDLEITKTKVEHVYDLTLPKVMVMTTDDNGNSVPAIDKKTGNIKYRNAYKLDAFGNPVFKVVGVESRGFEKGILGLTHFRNRRGDIESASTAKRKNGTYQWNTAVLPKNTIVIMDEIHKCKSVSSLNGELLRSAFKQGYTIHGMSASAASNPQEMYSLGLVFGLHDGSWHDFDRFLKEHGCQRTGKHGQYYPFLPQENPVHRDGLIRIHEHLKQEGMVRVRRADVPEFPESKIFAECVDMDDISTKKINAIYDVMNSELAELEENTKNYIHVLSIMMKARRKTELLKVPLIMEQIEDALDDKKSVVIFANFTDTIVALSSRLDKIKVEHGFLIGASSDLERDRDIVDFQNGKIRVMLVNIAAGGAGVNLQDLTGKNERYVIALPTFLAQALVQSMGRVWRLGGGYSTQRIIFVKGTIEEKALNRVRSKIQGMTIINDGSLSVGDLLWETIPLKIREELEGYIQENQEELAVSTI